MATRYFRKHSPNVKLFFKCTGKSIHFEPVGQFGYLASNDSQIKDDPKMLAEIDVGMANGVGGVSEITFAQYDDAIKKKASSPSLRQSYREEILAGRVPDTLSPTLAQPAAVASAPAPPASQAATSAPQPRPLRDRVNLGTR